ncbi:amidohydrolase family protein [Planctomycetota bacterium]
MIVDCHTHIGSTGDNVEVAEHLDAAETVDVSIVLAGCDDDKDVNRNLADYISSHSEKMIGFALLDPLKEKLNEKSLVAITSKLALKGLVLYCSTCGFHPAHSRAMRFYALAEQLNLPIFFHPSRPLDQTAVLGYDQPVLLDEIAGEFQDLKIIIGNMGRPFIEQTLAMIAKHKNVYADLTIKPNRPWQIYNIVVAAFENNVMDKLLFGSGFPSQNPGECIETLLGFNKILGETNFPTVPRSNIRNVIEQNSLELLGIEK